MFCLQLHVCMDNLMKIIENNGIVAKLTFRKYFLEIHVRTGEDALSEKDLYCVNVYVKISE